MVLQKKSLILDNLAVGFSFVNTGNTIILNSAGTKSYTDRYLTDAGATGAGMPATAREGDTYTINQIPLTKILLLTPHFLHKQDIVNC